MSDIEGKAARVNGDGVRATTEFQTRKQIQVFLLSLANTNLETFLRKGTKPIQKMFSLLTSVPKNPSCEFVSIRGYDWQKEARWFLARI